MKREELFKCLSVQWMQTSLVKFISQIVLCLLHTFQHQYVLKIRKKNIFSICNFCGILSLQLTSTGSFSAPYSHLKNPTKDNLMQMVCFWLASCQLLSQLKVLSMPVVPQKYCVQLSGARLASKQLICDIQNRCLKG